MDEWAVREYRVEGDEQLQYDWRDAFARRKVLGDLNGAERAIYVRPWGWAAWGWHSGPHSMDAAARASHGLDP